MERYFITKEIGSGSFGKVYQVEAKSTGIHYVAKLVDLSKLDRKHAKAAEKEIQVLSKLKHPNIVRYKEAYVERTDLYIIMELCEMGDLHSLIQDTRQKNDYISESLVMQYFVQISLALNYTHRQRILHRDVKTKNIFLKKGNIIKLGDFGVAKVLENSLDLAETCTGSPFYISPEICNNQPYDKKSDVWALGCVLFEMTTLRYAFTGKSMKSLILKITTGDYAPLPANVAPKIRHLIRKLLTCNPRQRPSVENILSWPFVSEVADKLHCKVRTDAPKRCLSGENLRCSNVNKPVRGFLPVSKSCLNLYESSITEPHVKYKPAQLRSEKKTNYSNVPDEARMNNFAPKNVSLETTRRKNLPKSDSKYYSLIAGSNVEKKGPQCSVVHNIFEKTDNEQRNGKEDKVLFGNGKGKLESNEGDVLSDQVETNSLPCEELVQRRKWEITTCDKRELITLLNEACLVSTFDSSSEAPETFTPPQPPCKAVTIDDLLFSTTLELPNIPALEPERINAVEVDRNTTSLGSSQEINDSTFVIGENPPSVYELLEKRRSVLEQCLGVERFLGIYKFVEKILQSGERFKDVSGTARVFNIAKEQVIEICKLVEDDNVTGDPE